MRKFILCMLLFCVGRAYADDPPYTIEFFTKLDLTTNVSASSISYAIDAETGDDEILGYGVEDQSDRYYSSAVANYTQVAFDGRNTFDSTLYLSFGTFYYNYSTGYVDLPDST